MALERYQVGEEVDPRPARDYSLDRIVDIGSEIRGIGRSLLNAAEPELRAKRTEEAIAAVGEADIIQSPDGRFIRPERKGGGLIYAQVFDRAMDQRYSGVVQTDVEEELGRLQVEHKRDPEAFKAAAVAHVSGVLEATNPRVRAELDVALTRDVSEKYRGLAVAHANEEHVNTVAGLKSQIELNALRGAYILATVTGPDAERRALLEFDKNTELYDSLVKLGDMDEAGALAERRSTLVRAGPAFDEAASQPAAMALLSGFGEMTDDQLRHYSDIAATGMPIDGKAVGVDTPAFFKAVPSERIRAVVGQTAARVLAERQEQRDRDLVEARAAEQEKLQRDQLASSAQILSAIKAGNYRPEIGMTEGDAAAEEVRRTAAGGNTFTRLSTRKGRQREIRFIQGSGYVSNGTSEVIEGWLKSDDVYGAAEFVNNVRTITSGRGFYAVGEAFYDKLPAQTRAALAAEERGRRLGMPRQAVTQMVRQIMTGENVLTPGEAKAQVGRSYDTVRNQSLASELKVGIGQAAANPILIRDFDEVLPFYVQLYKGDLPQALKATAEQVTRSFVKHDLFLGGIAPRAFATSGISEYALNQLPEITDPRVNPLGARFGQKTDAGHSRVLLQPRFSNQRGGLGQYDLIIFDKTGKRRIGPPHSVNLTALWGRTGIPAPPAPAPRAANGAKWVIVYDREARNSRGVPGQVRNVLRSEVLKNPQRYTRPK